MSNKKKRWLYAALILFFVPFTFATRWYPQYFFNVIDVYGGDVFSATTIFFGFRFLMPQKTVLQVAVISYITCVLIEIQQLYQAPWAVEFRNIPIVGYILGHGFLWSDIVCYAVGVVIGYVIAVLLERMFTKKRLNQAAY